MLQSMRNLAQSWVVKTLMMLLMVSFSIWGIGDIFRGNALQKTVAKVGGESISVQDLNRLFDSALAQARQRLDPNLTAQKARQLGLLDRALDGEINRIQIDKAIARLGINVSPKSVLQMFASEPQFQNEDGTFNKKLFQEMLERRRQSERVFIAAEQQELARNILVSAIEGSHTVPQTAVNALFAARAQKRILDVVTVDAAKIGGIATPDDKALHAYYDANPNLFMAPEYRGITVATLSTDALAKEESISDEQLKKEFEQRREQLARPERRDVVQVVLQSEDAAKKLAEAARREGHLTAAAQEAKQNAIPLDQLEENKLMPELAKAVFALHENEISAPVKTPLGWHVIQLKKITAAGTPNFDKIKDKLREDMRRDQAIEAATRIINQIDDQLAAGHSLEDIADALRLRLVKIAAVDAKGLQPDGKEPPEFPHKDDVLRNAFSLNAGETGSVEEDKNGNYYVVRTDDITPAGVRPFDAIKDKIAAAWKAHEQANKAEAKAEAIAKALRDGKPFAAFDGDEGVSSRSSAPLSELGDIDPQLPQDLMAQAFKIKKGETAVVTDGTKRFVARLAKIIDAEPTKDDARKNLLFGDIKRTAAEELGEQYLAHLGTLFPVKKDTKLLNTLRQQEGN